MPSNKEKQRREAEAKRAAEITAEMDAALFREQFTQDALGVDSQARAAADILYGKDTPEVSYRREQSPFEASQRAGEMAANPPDVPNVGQTSAEPDAISGAGEGVPSNLASKLPEKSKSEQLLAGGPAAANPAILNPTTSTAPTATPGAPGSLPASLPGSPDQKAQAVEMANALTTEQPAQGANPNQPLGSGSPAPGSAPEASASGSPASGSSVSGASGSIKTTAGSPELLAKYDTYRQAADEQMMGMFEQEAYAKSRQLEDRNNNGIPDAEEEAGDISKIMEHYAAAAKDLEAQTAKRLLANNQELKARKTGYMQQMQRNLEYLSQNPINPMAVAGSGAGMAGMAGAAFFDTYYALKGWKVPSMTRAWDDAIARNLEHQKALMESGKEVGEGFKQLWSMAVSAADTEKDVIENMKAMYATSLMASQLRGLAPYKAAAAQRDRAEITAKVYGDLGKRYMDVANHFKQAYDSEWKMYEAKERLALGHEKAKLGNRAASAAGAAGAYRASAKAQNISAVVSPAIVDRLGWKDEKGNLEHPIVVSRPVMEADGRVVMAPILMLRKAPTTEGTRKTLDTYSNNMIEKQGFINTLAKITGPQELASAWRPGYSAGVVSVLTKRMQSPDSRAAGALKSQLGTFLASYIKSISGAAATDQEVGRLMKNVNVVADAETLAQLGSGNTSPEVLAKLLTLTMDFIDRRGQSEERLMLSGSFGDAYRVPDKRKAAGELNAERDNMIYDELTQARFKKDAPEHTEAGDAAVQMTTPPAQGVEGVVKYRTASTATAELQQQRIEDALKNPPFGLDVEDVRYLTGIKFANGGNPTGLSPAQLKFLRYIREPAQGAAYIDTKPLLAGLAKYRKERTEGRPGDEVLAKVKESAAQIGGAYAKNYKGTSEWPKVYNQISKELGSMLTSAGKQALEALNQEVAAEPDLARGQAILKARLKAIVDSEVDTSTKVESLTPKGFADAALKNKAGANK